VIEGYHGVAARPETVDGGAVDEDDVEAAVIIAIEEADAAADGVNDVVGIGGGNVRSGYAEFPGDVFEHRNWRELAAIGFGFGGVWPGEDRRDGDALGSGSLRKKQTGSQQKDSEYDMS
jgi:hypothetical protein